MSVANDSLTSHSSFDGICVQSSSLATIDVSKEDKVNLIESDDNSQPFATTDYEMEMTPYPYVPSSEEMIDYYHLEESLGEDWSLRLACELSLNEMSMDDGESTDESLSFAGNDGDDKVSPRRPEDIEFSTSTNNYFGEIEVQTGSFSKYETF
jgi:hypothetical protein